MATRVIWCFTTWPLNSDHYYLLGPTSLPSLVQALYENQTRSDWSQLCHSNVRLRRIRRDSALALGQSREAVRSLTTTAPVTNYFDYLNQFQACFSVNWVSLKCLYFCDFDCSFAVFFSIILLFFLNSKVLISSSW